MSTQSPSTGTEAAARVADVLLLFTSGPASLGVSTIAREIGVGKSVVHRILQSLVSRGLVEFDPPSGGYRLGSASAALGARALRDSDMRLAARPHLQFLREMTGETATLSGIVGSARTYLDQLESPRELRVTLELGRHHPLHAGAVGKAILAFLPAERQGDVLGAPLRAVTSATRTDADDLRGELARIRHDGVAVSRGERQEGIGSVAAPVLGIDGSVVGAVSACGPLMRFDDETVERIKPNVMRAAKGTSLSLGWVDGHVSPGG